MANLRERLERFRQKRAEAGAAAQQPVPPENSTSLAGAQITARQAQQAGAKARQQAKQASARQSVPRLRQRKPACVLA